MPVRRPTSPSRRPDARSPRSLISGGGAATLTPGGSRPAGPGEDVGVARCLLVLLDAVRACSGLLGVARGCSGLLGVARGCSDCSGCSGLLGVARRLGVAGGSGGGSERGRRGVRAGAVRRRGPAVRPDGRTRRTVGAVRLDPGVGAGDDRRDRRQRRAARDRPRPRRRPRRPAVDGERLHAHARRRSSCSAARSATSTGGAGSSSSGSSGSRSRRRCAGWRRTSSCWSPAGCCRASAARC